MYLILVIMLMIIFFVEKRFSSRWKEWYFKFGLPIFYYKSVFYINKLNPDLKAHSYDKKIQIKNNGTNVYYFMKGSFRKIGYRLYEYSPIRGYLNLDYDTRIFKTVFFLNWHQLILLLILFSMYIDFADMEKEKIFYLILIIIFVIGGILYSLIVTNTQIKSLLVNKSK